MKPEKVEMFKCPVCYEAFNNEHRAEECIYHHYKAKMIDYDFFTLGMNLCFLNQKYGFLMNLTEAQETITKDSCFTISYLQGCNHPAYRINKITHGGSITTGGSGGYNGYYQSEVKLRHLTDPRPKEELYSYPPRSF